MVALAPVIMNLFLLNAYSKLDTDAKMNDNEPGLLTDSLNNLAKKRNNVKSH